MTDRGPTIDRARSARPHGLLAVGIFALAAASGPHAASAQAVRGTLLDDRQGGPVATATVTLLQNDEALSSTITDERGFFLLEVPHEGVYRVEAERLGYATARSSPLTVESTDTVTVEFRISPDAVLLEPLLVTARSNLGRSQFKRRMEEWGEGIFVTPEMVDSIQPRHPADVMRNQEDVWLSWGWGGSGGRAPGPVPRIRTFKGAGCMRYSLNGNIMQKPVGSDSGAIWQRYPLDGLTGDDIVAVEVYRSLGEAPPEVRRLIRPENPMDPAMCGLTIFWTREGW